MNSQALDVGGLIVGVIALLYFLLSLKVYSYSVSEALLDTVHKLCISLIVSAGSTWEKTQIKGTILGLSVFLTLLYFILMWRRYNLKLATISTVVGTFIYLTFGLGLQYIRAGEFTKSLAFFAMAGVVIYTQLKTKYRAPQGLYEL